MKASFEQEWQNALSGASVAPSDAVWENIATSMDKNYGRRGWVTLLIVAATITLAFSFPLTIGNSSFEVMPDDLSLVSKESVRSNNIAQNDAGSLLDRGEESAVFDKEQKNSAPMEDLSRISLVKDQKPSVQAFKDEPITPELTAVAIAPEVVAISDLNFGFSEPDLHIDSYYMVPFIDMHNANSERGLLALAGVGSGNRSVSSGLGGSDALFASSDFETNAQGNQIGDARSEEGGTTFNFGFGFELPLGRKFSLVSGLGYMNQRAPGISNVVFEENGNYAPMGAYNEVGPGTVFLSDTYSYTAINGYLNIPLSIKYPFVDKQFKIRGGVGISSDFMLSNKISASEFGTSSYNPGNTNYKPYGISGLINLDVQFKLNNSYAIALETGIRKGITSINTDGTKYPLSFNIGIILYYQFLKK